VAIREEVDAEIGKKIEKYRKKGAKGIELFDGPPLSYTHTPQTRRLRCPCQARDLLFVDNNQPRGYKTALSTGNAVTQHRPETRAGMGSAMVVDMAHRMQRTDCTLACALSYHVLQVFNAGYGTNQLQASQALTIHQMPMCSWQQ
jgi:hypothetical protein